MKLLMLVIGGSIFFSCRSITNSELNSVTQKDSDFHGRKAYVMTVEHKDDIVFFMQEENKAIFRIRTVDAGVKTVDTSGYDNGITFMNFFRNITNNFGKGLTSKTVVIEEKLAKLTLFSAFEKIDLDPGDEVQQIKFCRRFYLDADNSKHQDFLLVSYKSVDGKKSQQAPAKFQAQCQ